MRNARYIQRMIQRMKDLEGVFTAWKVLLPVDTKYVLEGEYKETETSAILMGSEIKLQLKTIVCQN